MKSTLLPQSLVRHQQKESLEMCRTIRFRCAIFHDEKRQSATLGLRAFNDRLNEVLSAFTFPRGLRHIAPLRRRSWCRAVAIRTASPTDDVSVTDAR